MSSDPFVHLHVASGFSLRYGASHPHALVERAVAAGATAGQRKDDSYTSHRVFADPDGHRWNIVWADPIVTTRE